MIKDRRQHVRANEKQTSYEISPDPLAISLVYASIVQKRRTAASRERTGFFVCQREEREREREAG